MAASKKSGSKNTYFEFDPNLNDKQVKTVMKASNSVSFAT